MKKTAITSVEVVNQNGSEIFQVGAIKDGREICSITDAAIEYPNAIHFVFKIYDKDGLLIAELINLPAIVRYEKA